MNPLSSPADLIKKSFQIFFEKDNFLYFLKIYAILVPFALFFVFQDSVISTDNIDVGSVSSVFTKLAVPTFISIIIGLIYVALSFWVRAAGIKAMAEVVGGVRTSTREVFGFAWKKLWAFSLLSILVGLVVGLGFLLLIVPGILFLVWFQFSQFEMIVKDVGIKEAMGNSRRLVAGRFWKVLGRVFVFGVFGLLAQMILGFIPMGFGGVILPLFGALLTLPYILLYQELSLS